jgi:hypothetical protein
MPKELPAGATPIGFFIAQHFQKIFFERLLFPHKKLLVPSQWQMPETSKTPRRVV